MSQGMGWYSCWKTLQDLLNGSPPPPVVPDPGLRETARNKLRTDYFARRRCKQKLTHYEACNMFPNRSPCLQNPGSRWTPTSRVKRMGFPQDERHNFNTRNILKPWPNQSLGKWRWRSTNVTFRASNLLFGSLFLQLNMHTNLKIM